METDFAVRIAAFNWLTEQTNIYGEVLPRRLLEIGFLFNKELIPLVSPQGIFKPKILKMALSITTAPKGPYEDSFTKDGFLKNREPTAYELKILLREESNKHFFSYIIYRLNNILKSKKRRRR